MTTTYTTMPFYIIDTLQFSKRLQKAGLQQEVSDELAEAIKESQTQSLDGLATKQDLHNLEQNLDVRINKLEAKVDSLEHKLTLKLFFMLSAAVAAITWLDKVVN